MELLSKLISTTRKIAFYLKEKPNIKIDDHVLEHMLFYHGLTGTSPENEKLSRMVKSDIKEALTRKNSSELSLALKLPPTLWEEKLKNIILSLTYAEQQFLVKLLLPPELMSKDNSYAVIHKNWQVRANAANMLVILKAKEAVPFLIESLNSDIAGGAQSFCYIAYALGKLQGNESKEALESQLTHSDLWLRTDAAGSLSYFQFDMVANSLAIALLNEDEALDYMAYAISRQHKPHKFLLSASQKIAKAGGHLISGIIEAAQNSFNSNLVIETESHLCLTDLIRLAKEDTSLILANAAISLCNWLSKTEQKDQGTEGASELEKHKITLNEILSENSLKENILRTLKIAVDGSSAIPKAELVHAIELAGRLNLSEAQALLIDLLNKNNLSDAELKQVIVSLGLIAGNEDRISSLLVDYVRKLINIDERSQLTKSKQPVYEENASGTRIYWLVLKTLANLPTASSISFLFAALQDYAPDKRSCALESIMAIYEKDSQIAFPKPIDTVLKEALKDSAPMMQLASILSIARLNRASLIDDVLPLIDAQENTVSKEALSCLENLGKAGHQVNIKNALKDKYKSIKEEHKRKRVMDILQK